MECVPSHPANQMHVVWHDRWQRLRGMERFQADALDSFRQRAGLGGVARGVVLEERARSKAEVSAAGAARLVARMRSTKPTSAACLPIRANTYGTLRWR